MTELTKFKILLVWEIIPERCELYAIELSHDDFELIKTANEKYINCDEPTRALDVLMFALCDEYNEDGSIPDYHLSHMKESGIDVSWYGRYEDCKLGDLPVLSGMTTVIKSGMML